MLFFLCWGGGGGGGKGKVSTGPVQQHFRLEELAPRDQNGSPPVRAYRV